MSVPVAEEIAAGAALVALVGGSWLTVVRGRWHHGRAERAERRLARRARVAAIEASGDDESFAPEVIRAAVDDILETAQELWRTDGRPRTSTRGDARLIGRWAESISKWGGRGSVRLAGEPRVDLLRVVNRPGEHEDRAVVRLRLRVHRDRPVNFVQPRTVSVDQRWTLGRSHRTWTLLSVDSDPLDARLLGAHPIGTEWEDQERLREQSLAEIATADRAPRGTDLAALIAPDAPVERQLRDLAQVDGRFDADLLDLALRHVVEAWEEERPSAGGEVLGRGFCRALPGHVPRRPPRWQRGASPRHGA
ncbi:MAG TPA: hypothetical protein VGF91_32100 [Solirubrobacteraceae bacterium]|jgi:hypothetical protein